jgi:hypothetical protein
LCKQSIFNDSFLNNSNVSELNDKKDHDEDNNTRLNDMSSFKSSSRIAFSNSSKSNLISDVRHDSTLLKVSIQRK